MEIKEFIQTKQKSDKPNKVTVFNPIIGDERKQLDWFRPNQESFLAKEIYQDHKCPFSETQIMEELKKSFKSEMIHCRGDLVEVWS